MKDIENLPKIFYSDKCEPSLLKIIIAVSDEMGVSCSGIVGPSRLGAVVDARQLFCFMCMEATSYSQEEIASAVNRKPGTVSYFVKKVSFLSNHDKNLANKIENVRKRIG